MKKCIMVALFLAGAFLSSTVSAQTYAVLVGASGVPTVSSCGTSPSVGAGSVDHAGSITVGGGLFVTSCTVDWSFTLPVVPKCQVNTYGLSGITMLSKTVSTTSLTLTYLLAVPGATIDYDCTIN